MLPEDWVKASVGEACAIKNSLRLPLSTEEREAIPGPYPYFGPTGVLGYIDRFRIDEEIALIGEDGDHFLKFRDRPMTLLFRGKANVNNHAHIIGDSESCSARWFYYWFMFRDITSVLSRQGVGRYKLTKSSLEELEISLPPKDEQSRIVRLLSTWDAAILTTERLLASSRLQRQVLLTQLLTGRSRLRPFSGAVGRKSTPHGAIPEDWSYTRIESIASEVSKKGTSNSKLPVLSCTKHAGLVDSLSYFKKQIFSKDLSAYKVVPRGCFVYATNHIEEGSIGYQDSHDSGLVSPMYTVFRTGANVQDDYLFRLLKTEHFRQIFEAATNSSVNRRGSLRWKDFKRLYVPLPPIAEQNAISAVFDTTDREASGLEKQIALLRQERYGLMRQLLAGKCRVKLSEPSEAAPA
jgi:type I restriction enzyme, S subunit